MLGYLLPLLGFASLECRAQGTWHLLGSRREASDVGFDILDARNGGLYQRHRKPRGRGPLLDMPRRVAGGREGGLHTMGEAGRSECEDCERETKQ